MNRKILFLFSLSVLLLFTSCDRQRVAKSLRQFYAETIEIPSDLQKITGRIQSEVGNRERTPALIIYHDSLSCSSCQISHLADLNDVYALADSLGTFEVMSIFSPSVEEYDEVLKNLIYRDFEYPVYIDFSGSFRQKNDCIPKDCLFHNFLIDSNGHPVFVGNPIASDDLWNLFNKALSSIE